MNRRLLSVVLCLLSLVFSSCNLKLFKSKKKHKRKSENVVSVPLDTAAGTPVDASAGAPAEVRALMSSLKPLWEQRIEYKTFSGKAKMDYEGPNGSVSFNANFRIIKDSLVWVHVSALGGLYNVARVMVTPDSFFMINYDKKEVLQIPVSEVATVLPVPVEFGQLQALFVGEPLLDGTMTYAEATDSAWSIHTADSNYLQQVLINKADSLLALGNLQTRDANGPKAIIAYSNYESVDDRKVSGQRVVQVQNGVATYVIGMNLVNLEFDKSLNFPFSYPRSFTLKREK